MKNLRDDQRNCCSFTAINIEWFIVVRTQKAQRNRFIFDMLIVPQLVNTRAVFYGTGKFITVFTTFRQLSALWVKQIQSTLPSECIDLPITLRQWQSNCFYCRFVVLVETNPWSRDLLETLIISELVKKFPTSSRERPVPNVDRDMLFLDVGTVYTGILLGESLTVF
jgi:hypothetical protein